MRSSLGWCMAISVLALLIAAAASADSGWEDDSPPLLREDRTQALHRRTSIVRARRASFDTLVNEAARRHRVRAELLHAIIEIESAYDPAAVSPAGAVGLMQLMPATAALYGGTRYGVADATDPSQNIAGGAAYLRDLQAQFGGNLHLVLAAYNAGEDAVERFQRQVPSYAETRAYVRRVVELLRRRSWMVIRWENVAGE
jgi:soluble lytic murein transglycosylase-like protein